MPQDQGVGHRLLRPGTVLLVAEELQLRGEGPVPAVTSACSSSRGRSLLMAMARSTGYGRSLTWRKASARP